MMKKTKKGKVLRPAMGSSQLLELSSKVARCGYWVYDVPKDRIQWSAGAIQTLNLPGLSMNGRDSFIKKVHHEDAGRVQAAFGEAIRTGRPLHIDYRLADRRGRLHWISEDLQTLARSHGKTERLLGVVQEVTQRRLLEEGLKNLNHKYEILTSATNDAMFEYDFSKRAFEFNPGVVTLFGHKEAPISGKVDWWKKCVHPTERKRVMAEIRAALQHRATTYQSQFRFRCADRQYKHVQARAYLLYATDGRPDRMIGALQDITLHVLASEEVRKLSMVASHTDSLVLMTDARNRIEYVNQSFLRTLGYNREEVIGRHRDFFLVPGTGSDEFQATSKDGVVHWFKGAVNPILDPQGKVGNCVCIYSDVTQDRITQMRLSSKAHELAALIENANVPIFGFDEQGNFNEWNKVSATLSGYSREEVLGRHWTFLAGQNVGTAVYEGLTRVMKGESITNFEFPFRNRYGRSLTLLISVSPRFNTNDQINGSLCVGQDLTEIIEYRNNLERLVDERTHELHAALASERELVELKSRFVSVASHEFRTPLATIALTCDFLKRYKHKLSLEDFDHKLDVMGRQVKQMTELLEDILNVHKEEGTKAKIQLLPVCIRALVEDIIREVVQAHRDSHQVKVTWNLAADTFPADEKLIRNILVNLLTNAIKYSPEAPTVDVAIDSDASGLTMRVRDYGIGIPVADQRKLYTSFFRASNASSYQGTGLGLTIVKKAVELLDGRLDFTSQAGQGTEFRVYLPLVPLEVPAA